MISIFETRLTTAISFSITLSSRRRFSFAAKNVLIIILKQMIIIDVIGLVTVDFNLILFKLINFNLKWFRTDFVAIIIIILVSLIYFDVLNNKVFDYIFYFCTIKIFDIFFAACKTINLG